MNSQSLRAGACVCVLAGLAVAQQYYGTLTGTITDPSGAVLPNVRVTATNLNKGSITTVVSNDEGIYRLINLTPDPYRLEVEATGFKKFVREPVLVETGRTLTVDVGLEVGASTESVSVIAAAPILETESGKTTATLEGKMVAKLPLDVAQRADERTIIYRLPNSNYGPSGRMMINGARTGQVRWDADGILNKGVASGGMMQEHSINEEAIQEWKYTLMNSGAESQTAARVTLLTLAGTNDFHGALYWDTHHSVFDAGSHTLPRGAKKPFSRNNWEGLNVNGPVFLPKIYNGRNRTFFQLTYEWNQAPTHGGSFFTTPSDAMRNGDFSGLTDSSGRLIPITDPTTGQLFANNQIPASRIYAGSKAYLDRFFPKPNIVTSIFANNAFGEFYEYNILSHRADIRVDQVVNKSNSFFFRINRYTNPSNSYYKFFASDKNISLFTISTWQLTDTHTFRPNLLNEFRFGATGNYNKQRIGVQASDVVSLLGIQGIPGLLIASGLTGMPTIGITGVQGISQFSHLDGRQRLWDFHDNMTYVKNRHTVRFGTNFRKDTDDNLSYEKPGDFNFSGAFSGFGVADFMLGLPFTATRFYPRAALGSVARNGWYIGLYVDDEFKVRPRLTVNVGLRWDANQPGQETHGLYYSFDPATGNLVVPSQDAIGKVVPTFPKAVTFVAASQAGFPGRLRNWDKNNFAPRIGFAWRPLGEKFVIRSAYGIFYDGQSLTFVNTSGPWGGSELFNNRITDGKPLWQWPAAYPVGVTGQAPGTASVLGTDRNLRNPYLQQWNFTLERQIEQTAFRLQYVGTKSTHLYWQRDLNVPPPSTIPFSVSRRPFQQYGSANFRTNGGNTTYNAMTLGAERRLFSGITFNSYFTWARMLTDSYDSSGEIPALDAIPWFPTFDRKKWRGPDETVPKFRWATTYYAELPFGRHKKFGAGWSRGLDYALGGWAWSGILNIETGWWFSPFYTGGADPAAVNFTSGPPDRIANGVRSNHGLQPNDFFLDPAAFVMPPSNIGRFGSAGINFLQEPSFWLYNSGFQKMFPIKERLRFELLAKFENIFNHGFWGHESFRGGLNLSNAATFGKMTGGQGGSRRTGFLLRLAW